jgi:phosphatidylserine decarboxylase
MVRDGYWYGVGFVTVAAVLWAAVHSLLWPVLPLLLAAFFLWFFRDPDRKVPEGPGLIVSPADGKVTLVRRLSTADGEMHHISIFMSVFNVHVNRAPISGTVRSVAYKKGSFLNAIQPESAEKNEQNQVEISGEICAVRMTQIAGLLARRIVFTKKEGDWVYRGERVGLIKFGSRVDVLFPALAKVQVAAGDTVKGGSSVLAVVPFDISNETAVATYAESAS